MKRWQMSSLLLLALLAAPLIAWAWSQSALLDVRVHDHRFDRVSIESAGCSLTARLSFEAPEGGYSSSSPERNYHRFKARVRLTSDQAITSPVFGNSKAGRRQYTFSYDTSDQGCWAKAPHKLQGVDVEACRGRRCQPDPFK